MSSIGIGALSHVAHTYLALRIGQMWFGPLDTCILVLALAAATASALKLWRIAQSEDRQRRLFDALCGVPMPSPEPSQRRHFPWYQRLGTFVAANQIISKPEQERLLAGLLAAGVKRHDGLPALVGAKVCSAAAFSPLCWLLFEWRQFFVGAIIIRLMCCVGAAVMGWRFPEALLSRFAARRRSRLETGMPDALDLLVICADAGLSLDSAIEQVSRVLLSSNPEVAEEFAATAAEMRVSASRGQALENLARRVGIASLSGIVAALNQSIRFGTPLADSLRILAAEMRSERLARFEERAARLPVLLTLPLMTFVLPSLIIVIGTPLALRIMDMLGKGP
jgi:tight adherence protein C